MLTKMTGGGTVTIGVIQYDDLLLNNVHSNVTLDHGLIKMNPVTADIYNGKENGAITIDMRPAQPVYTVNLKTEKVDANKLISSVSDVKQTIYGMLASNVNASFSSSSSSNIARSLNGNMAIDLTNGKLMNLDLLHELASVGKFVGNGFGPPKNFTDLVQLTGNFDVKNGLAQTNNLKAVIDGGTLAAAGLVNLADQSLNLHVMAVLNKALSQQVGGTQVGGFMNTALSNNQGELVLPVIVTGTLPASTGCAGHATDCQDEIGQPAAHQQKSRPANHRNSWRGAWQQKSKWKCRRSQPAEGRHRRDSGCNRRQATATKPAATCKPGGRQQSRTAAASHCHSHSCCSQPGRCAGSGAEQKEERGKPHANAAAVSS